MTPISYSPESIEKSLKQAFRMSPAGIEPANSLGGSVISIELRGLREKLCPTTESSKINGEFL